MVAGAAGDEPGQFALVQGCAAVLFFEHVGGDVGAHLRPHCLVNGGVPVRTDRQVVIPIRLSEPLLQLGFAGVDPERATEGGRGQR